MTPESASCRMTRRNSRVSQSEKFKADHKEGVRFEVIAQMFHHVGRKVARQFTKEIQNIFLPGDKFTCYHRHSAKHMIDCDSTQFGATCRKVFLDRAWGKRLRSRDLMPPKRTAFSARSRRGSKVVAR